MGDYFSSRLHIKPLRKGTAHIIKQYKPVVVPIVIDGFRRSFDRKVSKLKAWHTSNYGNKKAFEN